MYNWNISLSKRAENYMPEDYDPNLIKVFKELVKVVKNSPNL